LCAARNFDYNYDQMALSGYAWPIIDLHLRYVKAARFAEVLHVEARLREWEHRCASIITSPTGRAASGLQRHQHSGGGGSQDKGNVPAIALTSSFSGSACHDIAIHDSPVVVAGSLAPAGNAGCGAAPTVPAPDGVFAHPASTVELGELTRATTSSLTDAKVIRGKIRPTPASRRSLAATRIQRAFPVRARGRSRMAHRTAF
jgi:hypothetical protein